MCRVVTCAYCHLYTWAGCGRHTDVLLRYPEEQRCSCGEGDPARAGCVARGI